MNVIRQHRGVMKLALRRCRKNYL